MTKSAARILCIEDEEDIRKNIAEELEDAGYVTIEAADGVDGLDAIVKQDPDLVVSDLTMPRMDGQELLRKLRSEHPERAGLPFIFLTALSDREHILEGKKLGADDYLTKPIDFDMLIATVEARLSQVQRINAQRDMELVKLYQSLNNNDAKDGAPAGPDQTDRATAPETTKQVPHNEDLKDGAAETDIRNRVQAMVGESGGSVVAGQVQIIGLEPIREALGERWQSLSETVFNIAQNIIRKHLAPDDVFDRTNDSDFCICFATLGEDEATAKAQTITREIQNQIIAAESLDPLLKENCDVKSQVHALSLTDNEIAKSDKVLGLVKTRLCEVIDRARDIEQETMARLVDNCRITPIQAKTAQGEDAPIAIAAFDESARIQIAALQKARNHSEDLAAELDILRLERTSDLLDEKPKVDQAVLLVNVSFSTLYDRRLLMKYLETFASLTETAKARLALNVVGIPKDLPISRVQSLLHLIRPRCRMIAADLQDLSLENKEPKLLMLSAVCFGYQRLREQIKAQPEAFKQLVATLKEQNARLLAYGVPDEWDAKLLFLNGVKFVAYSD